MMTEQHWTSAELLARFRAGDEPAAEEIFERYVSRLTLLARARLSPRLAARTDPEDIVLSAWRSFFIGARNDHYSLRRSGDLWRLLVSITMHKLYRQVRHHSAARRAIDVEMSMKDGEEVWQQLIDKEPTPEEAITLADELEVILAQLDDFGRRVLELRLQGEQIKQIAVDTGRSERTVRRTLAQIREQVAAQMERDDDD
jgi:RNA polymerase sigma factor (sigma-70 family)